MSKNKKKRAAQKARPAAPIVPNVPSPPVAKSSLRFKATSVALTVIGVATGFPGEDLFRKPKMFILFYIGVVGLFGSFIYDFARWQTASKFWKSVLISGTVVLGAIVIFCGQTERFYHSVSPIARDVLITANLTGKLNGGDYTFSYGQSFRLDEGFPSAVVVFGFNIENHDYHYEIGAFKFAEQTLEELQEREFIEKAEHGYRLTQKGKAIANFIAWRRSDNSSPPLFAYKNHPNGTIVSEVVLRLRSDNTVEIDRDMTISPKQILLPLPESSPPLLEHVEGEAAPESPTNASR